MTRARFLRSLAAAPAIVSAASRRDRPNLVLFLADDHGWRDSPIHGNRDVRTPNLERIASEGTVFRNTFSGAAICIPSRAILGSGLDSHRNGAIANGRQMRDGIRTLPSYLGELGYDVAHFGKSHFLPPSNYTGWEAVASEIKGSGPLLNDLDTAAVDSWLARRGKGAKPVCMIVCCHSPHVTWEENSGYDSERLTVPPSLIDTRETREALTRYYTDVSKMDRQLGEVHDSVRRHLGANTLFLSTSDNGAQFPFAKWNLYDAGIRLPLAASWPGVVKAGGSSSAMLHFTDFLPTFVELAGGRAPSGIDGRSFARVLRGESKAHRGEIFASHTADNNGQMNCYPMRSVRTASFHYIRNPRTDLVFTTHIDRGVARDGRGYWDSWRALAKNDARAAAVIRRYHERPAEELYDVERDPFELTNLAGAESHRRTLVELRGKVDGWMRGMGDSGEVWGTPRPLAGYPV